MEGTYHAPSGQWSRYIRGEIENRREALLWTYLNRSAGSVSYRCDVRKVFTTEASLDDRMMT